MLGTIARNTHASAQELLADVESSRARAASERERADELAQNLSHGEQRVLEVGLAMATAPKLLLLDEPMAGTGPEESQRIVDLIDGLKNRVAILLVEHDMDAVFRLADRISVMVNGAVIACGEPQAIRSDPMVIAAYLGEEHSA